MNNTMHMTELRVWKQCVYYTQQLWQKKKNDHFPSSHDLRCSRHTPILIRDLHTCSEVLHTVTTAFSNRTVVEGNKFQNFLRYTFKLAVASTCEDCQLCGTTSPSTAMEKVLELSTLSFSRLFVSFTNSFVLFATFFLGNEMSFKDPIWCDYKLAQFSSHFIQRLHLMWLQTWSVFITLHLKTRFHVTTNLLSFHHTSFKDPILCDYKLGQFSSHFIQRPHLMWLQICSVFNTLPSKTPFDVTTNLLSFHHTSFKDPHLMWLQTCSVFITLPSKTPFDVTTNLLSFHHTSITNSSAVQALECYALWNITPPEGIPTLT